jgi:hypothetical protein
MHLPEPTRTLVDDLRRLADRLGRDPIWRGDAPIVATAAIRLGELGTALEELFVMLLEARSEMRED